MVFPEGIIAPGTMSLLEIEIQLAGHQRYEKEQLLLEHRHDPTARMDILLDDEDE